MLRDKKKVIALCVVLFVVLAALIVCEHMNPEAGSELIRGILGR